MLARPPGSTAPAAAVEWRRLGDRLRSVTPKAIGRAALALTVVGSASWLALATWPALLPFAIGAVIAYAVLPLVDALDGILPRSVASLASVLLLVAAVLGFFVVIVPPFARTIGAVVGDLPTRAEIDAWVAGLEASTVALPGSAGPILADLVEGIVSSLRSGVAGSARGIGDLAPTILQAVIGAVAAALGLVVLPAWILTMLRDQRQARGALLDRLPARSRADAAAVIRIVDRSAATYLRGQVPRAVATGLVMGVLLVGIDRLGLTTVREVAPIAVFAGAVQLIPEIGGLIGFLPALIVLPLSPERAAVYVATYVGSRWAAGGLLGHVGSRRRTLHPVVMVPALVALSTFGLIWLFIAGPILAAAYDLVRYAHGRLSEPSAPAGVIPDEAPARRPVPARAARRPVRRQPGVAGAAEVSGGG